MARACGCGRRGISPAAAASPHRQRSGSVVGRWRGTCSYAATRRLDVRVRVKPFDHAVVEHRVRERHQRHALVVREECADDDAIGCGGRLGLARRVVDGVEEAVGPERPASTRRLRLRAANRFERGSQRRRPGATTSYRQARFSPRPARQTLPVHPRADRPGIRRLRNHGVPRSGVFHLPATTIRHEASSSVFG